MNRSHLSRTLAALIAAALFALPAAAQNAGKENAAKEYTPQVGQEGKDVIWVPTPQALVERMLDMAKLTPKDIHYDLGSGDGRTVITAAKRGVQAVGRSEEHTSELQSQSNLVCRLLLEKKKNKK